MKSNIKRLGKNILLTLLVVAAAVAAVGCGVKYTSHFSATVLVSSNDSDSARMSFSSFNGTKVFKVKVKDADSVIRYSGTLESGSITVYYDDAGTKEEWFTLQAGESVDGTLDNPAEGKCYIIVETDGRCKEGKLSFEVEKP